MVQGNQNGVAKKTSQMVLRALLSADDLRRLEFTKVVLLSGYPGSGKSTLSRLLHECYGFERISTDQIRTQELFPDQEHRLGKEHTTVMASRFLVYEELGRRVVKFLQAGKRVVVDGTHLDDKRFIILGAVLSQIPPEQMAFLVLQPPEWIVRRRFKNVSEKDYKDWWSVYKFWRAYMKKGKASYPTPSIFPRIPHIYVKRYALKTFDWVPNISGIIWRVDTKLRVQNNGKIFARNKSFLKMLSSLTYLRDFVMGWTDELVWFDEFTVRHGVVKLKNNWKPVSLEKKRPKHEIYELIVEHLKIEPGHLLVVSDNDEQSIIPAKRAGLRTCAVECSSREADVRLPKIKEVAELFGLD